MTDLKKRLHPMEQVDVPDLWEDIERRRPAPQPEAQEASWRRVGIVLASFMIAVGAVALAVTAFSGRGQRPVGSPTPTPPLARNGVIAYGSIAHEGLFWTVEPDGSHRTAVHVDVAGFVGVPSWSLDGTRIAFTLQSYDDPHPEGGNYDIYTANADGSDPVRLTHDQNDRSPVWSPDGTRVAYVRESTTSQIWVMNADGSDAHRLTQGGDAVFPTWSSDGSKVAYVSWDGTDANIYVMNADGSDARRLTDDPAHEDNPEWSPDGRTIAFTSEGGSRDPGIYTMAPDGSGVAELLPDPDPANLGFAWAPDATSMAVVSIRGPGNERTLYVLDVASRELGPIADPGAYFGPSWQPLPPAADSSPRDAAQSCDPDLADAWRTKMAPWLASVLLAVGSPEGLPLGEEDIRDTGSALQIGNAGGGVTLYVHGGVPDLEHDPRPSMVKFGSVGDYGLYASGEGKVRQFSAFGPTTWLSLSAYADTAGMASRWESDTDERDWLERIIAETSTNPIPTC